MDFKIRQFIEDRAQIVITIEGYDNPIAVDLPLDDNNNVPTGEDLHSYVQGFIPIAYMARLEKLKSGVLNAAQIRALVEPLPEPESVIDPNAIDPSTRGVSSLP